MIGAPPDIDGFVAVLGDASLIVNGVPTVFSKAHYGWKILEPRLVKLPNVESNIEAPVNTEELRALNPDIVLTMDPTMASQIGKLGVPTVCITEEGPGEMQDATPSPCSARCSARRSRRPPMSPTSTTC